MITPLTTLSKGQSAKIVNLGGGYAFQSKLRAMGIRKGKIVRVLTVHPFGGPIVIQIGGRNTTLGRGMAQRILVEG